MRRASCFVLTAVIALAASPLAAQEPIATDRPDFVESSATVGHKVFQVETSAATDWTAVGTLTARTVGTPTLFRYGIGRTLELRLETDGWQHATLTGLPAVDGLADAAVGIKWHAADAKGARPSVAFLLHGDLPSGSSAFRGVGVRPSFRGVGEWELPRDFSLGVMPGIAYAKEGATSIWSGIFGVTVGHPITETLRGFVEYSVEELPFVQGGVATSTFDVGTALQLTNDAQLDLSANFGLTQATPDGSVAIGFSRRWR